MATRSATNRRVTAIALTALLAGAALYGAACGSEAGGEDPGNGGDGGASSSTSSGAASSSTSSGAASSTGDVDATSITVDPPSTTLDVSGTATKTVQLVAHALPSGAVITPAWTLDNPTPGAIDANGLYTTSNKSGGVVHVTATYKGLTASAVINVNLTTTITSGTVPNDPAALFDPTGKNVDTSGPNVPSLVYPVNGTMFPQNVFRVLFQWRGHGQPLFQIEMMSPTLKAAVYTDGVHATCTQAQTGGSCWESDANSWTALAASNAGKSVTMKIRAVDNVATPTTIYESPAYTLHFSQTDVPGAIYYWSTTVAGVRRGAMGDPGPRDFLTPPLAQNKCVACHTVSKNGKLMAADIGGESLGVVKVTPAVPPPVNFGPIGTPPTKYSSSWATFDPDAKFVVQSRGGVMTLRDSTTGATVGANAGVVPLGANVFAVQPDWALDGKHIAFAASNSGKNATKDRAGGPILAWLGTTVGATDVAFGAVEVLQAAQSNVMYGYPFFNPTSEYISFVKGKKIEKDLTDRIWLTKAAPGETPVELVRANTLVSDSNAPAAGVENNMATWAPTKGPDVQWVAFTSKRDYGFVLCDAAGTTTQVCSAKSTIGSQMQQVWIAAIDVSKLGTGQDPSYPAFRVPFMELTENAHRPFWAEDVLKNAPPPDAGAYDAGPCVTYGNDCTGGPCCAGAGECIPENDVYTCKFP